MPIGAAKRTTAGIGWIWFWTEHETAEHFGEKRGSKVKKRTAHNGLENIDREITALKDTIERREQERAAAGNTRAELQAVRDKLLEDENADGEGLKELRQKLWEATEAAGECERRLELAAARMQDLHTKRAEAFRRTKAKELLAKTEMFLADCAEGQKARAEFREWKKRARQSVEKMASLALAAGHDPAKYRKLLTHIDRCLKQEADSEREWMTKTFRDFYSQPIPVVVAECLKGIHVEKQPEPQRKAG